MRTSWWIGICAICLPTSILAQETTAFTAPENAEANRRAFQVLQLLKRDGNCPSGYTACSDEGNSDACCKKGTFCTKDSANNIACCPTGATCTGSLTGSTAATETTGSSFVFPQGATATTTATTTETGSETASTISGAYPFVYVPTSFSNAKTCSSYYSRCQSEYTGCTQALMGRYGVTVGGSGGAGVTVEAVTATSQATSICSSLSAKACHGLSLGYCESVAAATATADATGNAAPVSGRASSLHDLAFGLVVGAAGFFI